MKNRVDSITQAVTYPLPFLHNNSSILWKPIKSAQSNQIYEKVGWDQNGIACGSVKPFGWQKGRCDSKGCGKAGWDQNGIAHGSVEPSPASGGRCGPKGTKNKPYIII